MLKYQFDCFVYLLRGSSAVIAKTPIVLRILIFVLLTCLSGPVSSWAGEKLNVIVIFADDQGYQDLGVFGSPNIKTPNGDRMPLVYYRFFAWAIFFTPSGSGPRHYAKQRSLSRSGWPNDRGSSVST